MRQPRWVVVALGSGAMGLLVLLGYLLRGPILERWYVRQLRSDDAVTRGAAIRRLVAMRSLEGATIFLERASESWSSPYREHAREALRPLGEAEMARLGRRLRVCPELTVLLVELHAEGGGPRAAALPVLLDALRRGDAALRRWSLERIARVGPDARHEAAFLESFLRDPDELVRLWAGIALLHVDPDGRAPPDPRGCLDPVEAAAVE